MHHRGTVSTPDGSHTRASVWIEQEIAIAAFLQQTQQRTGFPVVVYMQRGIRREGVRELLHLNPIEFDSASEVLADLGTKIREGYFFAQPKRSGPFLVPRLSSRTLQPDHPEHELIVALENRGTETAHDYSVRVRLPKRLLIAVVSILRDCLERT